MASLLISSEFAIYSVANFKLPFVQLIYTSIGSVALPKLSKIRDSGTKETKQIWHKMIVTYTLITMPFLIYFELVAKDFILFLYTEKYFNSIIPFRIFLLIMLFQMLSYGTILKAYAKTKFILKSNLIVMLIGFPISLSFIKTAGTVGGAISAVIIFGLNAIIQVYKTKQILKLKLRNLLPWMQLMKISFISLIPIPLIFLITNFSCNRFMYLVISALLYFSGIFMIFTKMKIMIIDVGKMKISFPLVEGLYAK